MRGEKLLLYLAVLLLVIGVYFYTESRHSRQLAEEKAAKEVFQVKLADIKALALKNDKGEIDLERVIGTGLNLRANRRQKTPTPAPPSR